MEGWSGLESTPASLARPAYNDPKLEFWSVVNDNCSSYSHFGRNVIVTLSPGPEGHLQQGDGMCVDFEHAFELSLRALVQLRSTPAYN